LRTVLGGNDGSVRVVVQLLALAYVLLTLFAGVYLFYSGAFNCWESCTEDGWTNSSDSWQWNALMVLAVLCVLAGLAATGLLLGRKRRAATSALAAHALVLAVAAVPLVKLTFRIDEAVLWFVIVLGPGVALWVLERRTPFPKPA
jgi:hypothetical protein